VNNVVGGGTLLFLKIYEPCNLNENPEEQMKASP
jgi:hypothetical protein